MASFLKELSEVGGPRPPAELMPAACPVLQLSPETDWMFTADPGAPSIMIGEKAAEMIAADHGVHLTEFAGATGTTRR